MGICVDMQRRMGLEAHLAPDQRFMIVEMANLCCAGDCNLGQVTTLNSGLNSRADLLSVSRKCAGGGSDSLVDGGTSLFRQVTGTVQGMASLSSF